MKKITWLGIVGLLPWSLFCIVIVMLCGIRNPILLCILLVLCYLAVRAGIIISRWLCGVWIK